jgi:S-adenosyl methyltransferase
MPDSTHTSGQQQPPAVDTTVPHSARVWNYWLGGQDNYPADRAVGDQVRAIFPGIVEVARAQRGFLTRAIRYLAAEAGIRQFLDAGSGLPTAGNTHEAAQSAAPSARVVYADNDPTVLAHARAVLTSTAEGAADYLAADLRVPSQIVDAAGRFLDLSQPVALVLLGVLGHISDDNEAQSIVSRVMAALPSGSFLLLADGTDTSEAGNEAQRRYNEGSPLPYYLRSPERIAGFFAGLELVEPGVVPCSRWRPDPGAPGPAQDVATLGGVARKP